MSPAEKLAMKKGSEGKSFFPVRFQSCRVREIRKSLNLTLKDVCEATGISIMCLSKIERGSSTNLLIAMKLAEYLGKSVEELWGQRK